MPQITGKALSLKPYMTDQAIQISVVIPLYNEEESLPELCEWIARVMDEHQFTYEVLFMDDGSKDRSWEVIQRLSRENPNVRGMSFVRNYGKTAALQTGFQILGQVAARELFADPNVAQGLAELEQYIDSRKIEQALAPQR